MSAGIVHLEGDADKDAGVLVVHPAFNIEIDELLVAISSFVADSDSISD